MMLIALRARYRGLRGDDAGVSLVEMTVTMVVLASLVSMLVLMVTAGQRVSLGVKERMTQSNMSSLAMERVSRNLRTAVLQSQLTTVCTLAVCTDSAFLQAGPTSVQFYADIDNPNNSVGPSRVTYSVTGGNLVETVQKPDSPVPDTAGYHYCTTGTGCVIRTQTLATNVQTATAVFSYYTSADPNNAMVMGTGNVLTAAQLKLVDSIDVNIAVLIPGGAPVGGATMVQRVALPNADSVVRTNGT